MEQWKAVVGYEGLYEVSDAGRVRSVRSGKMRRLCAKRGWTTLALSKNGKAVTHLVHRLVLSAFVGPCPAGMECRHLNGDPTDNRLVNLRWGTRVENAADRTRHGNTVRGVRVHNSKLTPLEVLELRQRALAGEYHEDLAREYGMSQGPITRAIRGDTWRHVPMPSGPVQRPEPMGERAYRLRAGGLSWPEVGRRLGTSGASAISSARFIAVRAGWVWPVPLAEVGQQERLRAAGGRG